MAQLRPTPANPPGDPAGRISQLLPSVKCSNCNQPVPLDELGDHTCRPTPPVPTLPEPKVSPSAVASLLPQRLQGRVAPSPPRAKSPVPIPSAAPIPSASRPSSSSSRPSSSASRPSSSASAGASRPSSRGPPPTAPHGRPQYQPKKSPLSRPQPEPEPTPSHNTSSGSSRPRPDSRSRALSTAGSIASNASTPTTARPSYAPSPSPMAAAKIQSVPPPRPESHAPRPQTVEPDTKTGGEAGMAGVGRRGFAAAARAAMFVMPTGSSDPPRLSVQGMDGRRANAPKYLDINTTALEASTSRCKFNFPYALP